MKNDLQNEIYGMIDAVRLYRTEKIDFENSEDYMTACQSGRTLLHELAEEGVRHEDLKGNGKGFRHFIRSLQILAMLSKRGSNDRDLIEIVYEESQRHAGEVEAELAFSTRNPSRQ